MTDIITLENIDVTFKQGKQIVNAVKNVNLNVEKGDIFGVVGYSGAGKSTLVRTINLLQKPTSGTVKVNGTLLFADNKQQISNKELQKQRRSIGMIFQHFNLLNETTVVDNVAFALRHSSLSDKEIEEKGLCLFVFVITDIVNSNSTAIVLGNRTDAVSKTYEIKDNLAEMPGVVSRKKQVLPLVEKNM